MKRSTAPVIVFRLASPVPRGTRIAEAGGGSGSASSAGLKQSPAVRKQRLAGAGVHTSEAPLVATVKHEPAWFFYADRAPFKAFQHAGQVVLVGARTGRVTTTRVLQWPPLLDGRLPAFMRTAEAYRSASYRSFYRPWSAQAAGARASIARSDAFGSLAGPSLVRSAGAQQAADMLAAQHACAARISDTLGDFYDFGNIDSTRARLGALFDGLAALNPGFRTVRYSTYTKRTPTSYLANLIKTAGCKQLLVYIAGGGLHRSRARASAGAASTAVIGTAAHADGTLDTQTLGSRDLERLVRANPGVNFDVIVDAPFSGGFVTDLGGEPNVSIVMSPVAGKGSFSFLPEMKKGAQMLPNPGNPYGLLEFSNGLLSGLESFFGNPDEASTAAGQTATGFMAWMFARAFQNYMNGGSFPSSLRPSDKPDPQIQTNFNTGPQTGSHPPKPKPKHVPVAIGQSLATPEDTPLPITLAGSDDDDDPLTFTVVSQPASGTLTGTAPNLVYTPAKDFNGADSFTFTVSDEDSTSAPATVSISVGPVNDPPVLSGIEAPALGYVNGTAGVPVTSSVAVADVDNANLNGALVKVTTGRDPGDDLQFTNQAGITGTYNSGTGVLTLTGGASKAAYQTALRSVRFHSAGAPSGDRTVTFQVDDGSSLSNTVSRKVSVDVAPTDISLAPSNVAENLPSGTTVGTLSSTDPDAGDSHTYTLVAGAGSTDNGSFTITGTTLTTSATFDFEAGATRSIRVRTDDGHGGTFEKQLTVTIDDVNDAPTDVALSNNTVAENQPSGTVVGDLTSTDQDVGDTHTYSLVAGAGSTDNGSFQISGNQLQTNASFDFETKSSYSVRVQSDDGHGGTFAKQLTVTVTDANDAPTDIALTPSSIAENQPSGTAVGTLSSTDQDSGDTHTYTLVAGTGDTDNAQFSVNGTTLETAAQFDFETKSSYAIRVQSDDGHGGTFEKQLTIAVTDANDAPTDVALSNNSVDENQPAGTTVGTLSSTDQDADTHTYSLVSGTGSGDNSSFQINGGTLETAGPLNFEASGTRSVRIRTDDGHGGTFEKVFTITVNDLNDAPTDIALSSNSVAENQAPGTAVGSLTATDEDAGQTHTYTLVAGAGADDNAQFQISGSTLQTNATFDFETKASYSIRVRATDDGTPAQTFEKQITITITNVNDAPTDIALAPASVAENQPSGTFVGLLSSTDQDVLDSHTYSLAAGAGDDDNSQFQISGSTLQTNATFDFETKSIYSIRLQTDDGNGGTYQKQFLVFVTDANDAPTDIALSNAKVVEHQAVGSAIGTLSTTDQDPDAHSYTLVGGAGATDNASFQISGTTLQNAADLAAGGYSIRVQTDDGHGGTFEKQFTITVVPPNAAPTDIALSNASVNENQPAGTDVGTLTSTDADAADTHTYSLVSGTGATDNASFQISGDKLQTATPLDYEAQSTYSVRIRTDDGHGGTFEKQFTVAANNINDAPTDIGLSPSSIAENLPAASTVGLLSTTDQDTLDTHTYTLVAGAGSDDNAQFQISGSTLQTNASFDFETKSSYSIRVRTDDGLATFEKQLTVTVTDANDPPTDISLTPSSVPENQPSGTTVGTLSAADQDPGDSHGFALVAGAGSADNGSFTISGNQLKTTASFDYETKPSYSIRVEANDGHGGLFEKALTVTVTDVNDAPTDISLSSSTVAENQPSGATVGTLLTADQDSSDSHTYTLVAGAGADDNSQFSITGATLSTMASFDYETKSSYSIRVQTDDGHGGTFEKQLTVTVLNVNDPPTDVALSNANVDENQPVGTAVGTLSSTDQDTADAGVHTYSLVAGAGATDNAQFTISGGALKTAASFNYEVKNSYSVRIQTDDTHGGTFSKQFTITINNVNDPPVDGNETTSAVGNTLLEYGSVASPSSEPKRTVSGNLLTNATDEDVPANTLTVSAFDATSAHGGTVSIDPSGTFTYRPAAGYSGADSFGYTVSDGQGGTDTSTVTVNVGTRVWYVKNNATAPGTGTSNDPFTSLASADTAANATGDVTYVYKGDGTTTGLTGGFSLLTSQKLLGEPVDLVVSGDTLRAGTPANRPALSGTVSLGSGSRIQGVGIAGAAGAAITGANSGGSTIDDVNVSGANGGVAITTPASGTFAFTKFTSTTTGGTSFLVDSTSVPTLNVGSASTESISATSGSGADIRKVANASSIAFDSVTASGGAFGVNLDTIGAAPASFGTGSVSGSTAGFRVISGSGTISYGGDLGDGTGLSADIQSRTGGTITLSGNISDGNDAGGGISMNGNSGGSTTFSGTTKTLNTVNGSGVAVSASSGHSVDFTNGGLDITTTAGDGFSVANTGSITVGTGPNPNKISSGAGTALSVLGSSVPAGGLNFQKISDSGGANGIVLSNVTGAGQLTVTGNSGTCTNANKAGCSGGEISGTTGADDSGATPVGTGIVLNNTRGPSLTRMWIHDHSNYAMRGTTVNGLTLDNSVIDGTNGGSGVPAASAASPYFEGGVLFDQLTGSATVSNTAISGGLAWNFQVRNNSGTLNRITFSSDDIGANSTANGEDGILLEGLATSAVKATVQNTKFTSARGDLFQYIGNGSGGGDLQFLGNTLTNNHPAIATGGGGVTISGGAAGTVAVTATNNTMQGADGQALFVRKSRGSGSMTATIDSNQIGVAGTANSGSVAGSGIELDNWGGGNMTSTVTNNQIRQYNNWGLYLQAGGGIADSGQFNTTIGNNTISNPGNNAAVGNVFQGFQLNSGVTPTDSFSSCLNITGGNSINGTGRNGGTDFRIRQRQATTVKVVGYGGAAGDDAALAAYVAGLFVPNPAAPTGAAVSDYPTTGGGFVGGAGCP